MERQPPDLAALYASDSARLTRQLQRICPGHAEDVVQEAYAIAARRWADVAECDEPLAWITTVANRLARRTKNREAHRRVREVAAQAHRQPAASRMPSDQDLEMALATLPTRHAAAVMLYYLEDRPVSEVAKELGVPEATVKTWLRRARITLSETLGDLSGRWVSEVLVGPDWCAAWMRQHELSDQIDPILEHMPRQRIRWVLEIADGRFWFGTDAGEHFDNGISRWHRNQLVHHQLPLPVSDTTYDVDRDGDVIRLRLQQTSVPAVGGVAARIHENLIHQLPLAYRGPLSEVSA